ncbi:PepSY domain-containing protein [Lederbergia lenta]|uniref:Putative peptidase propeptide n=1 Tax=Lederbergia lenta TaxID=1467 RepID=A0A2X4WC19_LEDLE|nr:PepSY domain-containing protein [Lederbergia lenta]MCM3113013.1 PepSY domain-containing protein [Lederbergia lenta]MEC2322739.1 PepSY domain-containing protein [Lederbergia lenta]SQI61696.1 putative peptidase propeptide [Lederbergia lenta]
MKRNLLIAGVVGFVILGGAVGAGAISNSTSPSTAPSTSTMNANSKENSSVISIEKATEIAIGEVGGVLDSVELDKENGRLIYEVELELSGNNSDVDVDIDAVTGEILKIDRDGEDDFDDDDNHQRISKNVNISNEEAISIALKDTPGKIIDVEFDSDDHEYEIEVKVDDKEVEIKVDANTGKIIKKEIDYSDD